MPTQTTLTSRKAVKTITQAGVFEFHALDGDDVVNTSVFNAGDNPATTVARATTPSVTATCVISIITYPLGPVGN